MTVIAATSEFLAADRRVTADGEKSEIIKVSKNPHLIAACAGYASDCLRVRRALAAGAKTPQDLVTVVGKGSEALVLTRRGKIFVVSYGEVWDRPPGTAAVGSGADLALGFLAGRCGRRKPKPKDVRDAFRYVFARRVDCGGRIDVRSF